MKQLKRISPLLNWEALLPAVTVAIGLQLWRALVPLLVAVLRNRFGLNAAVVGTVAFGVLLAGFLAAPLRRWLGRKGALVLTAGGTGLFRLAMQVWTGDPAGELALALAGSVLFILALVSFASSRRSGRFAIAALLGLALDLALHGFWQTYDLSWREGAGALLVIAILLLTQAVLLAREVRRDRDGRRTTPSSAALAWLSVGPYFLLALLAGQNVARLTVMTDWEQATTFTWMAAGQTLTLLGVIWLSRRSPASGRTLAIAGLLLLFVGLAPPRPAGGWAAAGYLLLHAGSALALFSLLRALKTTGRRIRWPAVALAQATTAVLFAGFVYLYHFHYGDPTSPSPFSSRLLPLLPAVLLAIVVLRVTWTTQASTPQPPISWRPALLAVALLTLPLIRLATVRRPSEPQAHLPLRVMTYNLHNGFDVDGHLGLEALAAVIEAEDPDVVMLQEVSRGVIIYGTTDMLAWLAQRLGMHAHFAPTADALWGLATLSRAPIIEGGSALLPPEELLIRRGVEWIELDVGADGRLTVVNNHFHHLDDGSDVRLTQAQAVVETWQGARSIIVGGDLNARPDTPEIERFRQAGWQDVGATGPAPGYTFSSPAPYERIDYLWLSPDLAAEEITVPFATASDHLPVVTTIRRAAGETNLGRTPYVRDDDNWLRPLRATDARPGQSFQSLTASTGP